MIRFVEKKQDLNEATAISLKKTLKDFGNIKELPDSTQKFLYGEIDYFQSSGFQSMLGYIGGQVVIDMKGYWDGNNKFYIESYNIGNVPIQLMTSYKLRQYWKR